jgi:hypothetical protein
MRAGLVLAVAGIVLAAALGFAAHVVAQDTIGLPAVSLKGGRPLAPEDARAKKNQQTKTTTERAETGESGETRPGKTSTTRTQTVDDHGGSSGSGSGEPGDDSGGHGRNRGSRGGGSDD